MSHVKPTADQIAEKTKGRLAELQQNHKSQPRQPTTVVRVRWPVANVERMREHFASISLDMSAGTGWQSRSTRGMRARGEQ